MHSTLLAGINILVTRPEHQAQPLCEQLKDYGGQPIRLPVIHIEAITMSEEARFIIATPDKIDIAIFISPNAVTYGLAQLLANGDLPAHTQLSTIGQSSANAMYQILGKMPDITPSDHYNSEALLTLEALQSQNVKGKSIVIFRGRGGREHLANTLQQRGATVVYAEVYQRLKTQIPAHRLATLWSGEQKPDIITTTSHEGLHNLFDINSDYKAYLQQTPLVVITQKMHDTARQLGFTNTIIIAQKATNDALLEAVLQWARRQ